MELNMSASLYAGSTALLSWWLLPIAVKLRALIARQMER